MKNPVLAGQIRGRLDDIIIENSRARSVHEMLEYLMAHAEARRDEPKRCALLTGPSQSGKTTIVKSFVRKFNSEEALTRKEIPVLHVTLQEDATRKQLLQNILAAYAKYGYADTSIMGTEAILLARVCTYLRASKVRLLVLDEFHHAVHSVSKKVNNSIAEAIKWLLIDGVCPILMVGIERARDPFDANVQLAHRAEPFIELHALDLHNHEDSELYMEFLSRFLLRIEDSGAAVNARTLLAGDIAGRIRDASGGVLGVACNLIKSAIKYAAADSRDSITLDDLVLANDELVATKYCKRNFFDEQKELVSL